MSKEIEINGNTLTPEEIVRVALGDVWVKLAEKAAKTMARSSAWVKKVSLNKIENPDGSPLTIFGINKKPGCFSDNPGFDSEGVHCSFYPNSRNKNERKNYLSRDMVRAFMLLRANTLARGHAGVRPVVVQSLLDLLNKGIHPLIPDDLLLGCQGDLMPPNNLLPLLSKKEAPHQEEDEIMVMLSSKAMKANEALKKAGIDRILLEGTEASALCNGNALAIAMTVMLLHDLRRLSNVCEAAAALATEALRGAGPIPTLPVQGGHGSGGTSLAEKHIRMLLKGSTFILREVDREPDANSLRCICQVLGNLRNLAEFASEQIGTALNTSFDNLCIIPGKKEPEAVFFLKNAQGHMVSILNDFLKLCLVQVGQSTEKRVYRLSNRHLSAEADWIASDKQDLNHRPDLHHLHALCASLSLKNRSLAHPTVMDNLPGGAVRDDYVSNAFASVKNTLEMRNNLDFILGIELLTAGIMIQRYASKGKRLKPGGGSKKILASMKKTASLNSEKGDMTEDLEKLVASTRDGEIYHLLQELFK